MPIYDKTGTIGRKIPKHEKTRKLNVLGTFPGTPGAIRTRDLPLRRRTLYPAELRVHNQSGMIGHQNAFRIFEIVLRPIIVCISCKLTKYASVFEGCMKLLCMRFNHYGYPQQCYYMLTSSLCQGVFILLLR